MKHRVLLTLSMVLGFGVLLSLAWVGVSHALNARSGDSVTVAQNETVNGTLYAAGRNLNIAGTVKGDVFCAGGDILITGTVEGDVICAGQNVQVRGKVLGDVRLAGQSVDLSADVSGSATLAGQSVVFGPDVHIGRDVTLAASTAHLDGKIDRDVLGGAQSVVLAGTVARDVNAVVDRLTLDGTAHVGGSVKYESNNQLTQMQGATVVGTVTQTLPPKTENRNTVGMYVWGSVYGFVAMFIVGLAGIALAPRLFDAVGETARMRPALSFAGGAASLLFTPIVGLLLLVSVFGVPLAFVVFLTWVAILMVALPVTAYAVGWAIVSHVNWPARGRRVSSLFVGLLLLTLVGIVPFIGGIVVFVAVISGLGAVTVTIFRRLFPAKSMRIKKA